MDDLARERFGPLSKLAAELCHGERVVPPPPRHRDRREHPTDLPWETYRRQWRERLAGERLKQARRDGPDDSWWEEPR
jgi:hypothetical protein